MQQEIVAFGASAAIAVSSSALGAAGLSIGDSVEVTARHGVLQVRKVSKYAHLSHEELMTLVEEKFGR